MNELKLVLERFPDCASTIQALAKRDPAFGEILAEYEEICAYFASHQNQPTSDAAELENVRQLILSLEKEILNHLTNDRVLSGEKAKVRSKHEQRG